MEELWTFTLQVAKQELADTSPTTFAKIDAAKVTETIEAINEDHMMNGQLKPEYNWQISTSNQFILQYSIHQTATDYNTLPTHHGEFERMYGLMPFVATADAGYGSEENHKFLEENNIKAFVKDNYFDKDQTGKPYHEGFNQTKLHYNAGLDCFYCPVGQPMKRIGYRKKTTTNGY